MPSIKVLNMSGAEVGEMELNNDVFGVDYNEPLIHQAVSTRLANERQGTKSTLTRTEVRGGGVKPWRQKGTGRARQGSIRAPQWIHGGVVFAPKPRDFSKKMNRTAKYMAFCSAISKKLADGEIIVVDDLKVTEGKTKEMVAFKKALHLDEKTLVVMDNNDELVIRAAANLPDLNTVFVNQFSTYEVVSNGIIVLTKGAAKIINGEEVDE